MSSSGNPGFAGELAERLAQFPYWTDKPTTEIAQGDLIYPDWFQGEWQVTSTLVEMVAPLAPEIITPGFESNRQYLDQPIQFKVRFQPALLTSSPNALNPFPLRISNQNSIPKPLKIVADRAFNGLNIATATLGDDRVESVNVDPDNPNRQMIKFRGLQSGDSGRQLISTVTERASDRPDPDQFVTSEITQQIFRGESTIYLNEVETTTAYQIRTQSETKNSGESRVSIMANQITAIYLSPRDPGYFKASGQPAALYRYQLQLIPVAS
ncbi:MAG: hypothetical protein HC835_15555 [Oscillatoriales cyanobacterium RM2_1_1]|nr:hypothetical protein [Oscillatoriales cyanobacterium SM2_3_0]NJO46916.1 hypothetical protein [Oscillatoriales cyanobacterium RM2_1_1]